MSDSAVAGLKRSGPRRTETSADQRIKNEPYDFQTGSLGYALRRAQVRTYDLYYAMLSSLELSPARLTALSIIATESEITQAVLAQKLGITAASVLKLVDFLEDSGLIVRLTCEDRRKYVLGLTPAGREKLEEVRRRIPAYEHRIAQQLSDEERALLLSLLERVAVDK